MFSSTLCRLTLYCGILAAASVFSSALAQTAPLAPAPSPVETVGSTLSLSALFAPADSQPVRSGMSWRVFRDATDGKGARVLAAESHEAAPSFTLENGSYIVHASCGLASATKTVALNGSRTERLTLNAGGLKVHGELGEAQIPSNKLNTLVYLPAHGDPEAKLIIPNLKSDDIACLPEGSYHIVSKLMDVSPSASVMTNSVIYADLRVQAGKLTQGKLRHRAAVMTLKLVNTTGGDALPNTSFSVLTPGGDVIRELIGAFPSLVLAEGEYVVIARHEGKTYQTTFKVASTQDRDVEVVAQ